MSPDIDTTKRQELISSLSDEEYRHALVEQRVDSLLPFQLRAMREERGWTQEQLGVRCGKKQEWISKLENPTYARFTLQTLKTLARAFDVALDVRFTPFSELVRWLGGRKPGDLRVVPYARDTALAEMAIDHQAAKAKGGALTETLIGPQTPTAGVDDFFRLTAPALTPQQGRVISMKSRPPRLASVASQMAVGR